METYKEVNEIEEFDPKTWKGKNSFICNNKIYVGPPEQRIAVITAHSLLFGLLILFSIFEVPYISNQYSPLASILYYILFLLSWTMLLLAEFTDPGILLSKSECK